MTSLDDFAKAIETGNCEEIQSWIDGGLIDVSARLPRHYNPPALVFAVRRMRKEIVDVLLHANARVNDADDIGWTACHAAVVIGCEDLLSSVLAHGPDVDVRDSNGRTPFDRSVEIGSNERIMAMLIEAGAPLDFINRIIVFHSDVRIRALLERGVAVRDLRDERGGTPLHWTAQFTFDPAVLNLKMLVDECGVDLDARDQYGITCCHLSLKDEDTQRLRWFIHAGASVDVADDDGHTPLHLACSKLDIEGTLVLLAAGANVHARSKRDETALSLTIELSSQDWRSATVMPILCALIAAGAEIDVADRYGVIPRRLMAERSLIVGEAEVESARHQIAKQRIDFVRDRAVHVCFGLQARGLDALLMCEILQQACGPVAPVIPFHVWWKIATTVKHFQDGSQKKKKKKVRVKVKRVSRAQKTN
jgi:ankyrin repeat protein